MKKVLMLTGAGVSAAVGAYYAIRAMRGARNSGKEGLGRPARTAGDTKAANAPGAMHGTGQVL